MTGRKNEIKLYFKKFWNFGKQNNLQNLKKFLFYKVQRENVQRGENKQNNC